MKRDLNSMKALEIIRLDFFNNFLTVYGFASHYGITEDSAKALLDLAHTIEPNEADR